MRRNSPWSGVPSCSSGIRCERSPLATAPMTRATSSVGRTRSPVSVLIDSIRSAQAPVAAPTLARCVIRPSLPMTVTIRAVSRVSCSSRSARSLNASAIAAPTTVSPAGRRTLKSPFLSVFSAASKPLASNCPFVDGAAARIAVVSSDTPSPAFIVCLFATGRLRGGRAMGRRHRGPHLMTLGRRVEESYANLPPMQVHKQHPLHGFDRLRSDPRRHPEERGEVNGLGLRRQLRDVNIPLERMDRPFCWPDSGLGPGD